MTKPEDIGITDVEQKWVLTARRVDGSGPNFSLLWRTTGPRGKPLPELGEVFRLPGFGRVRVERIDPPGSFKVPDTGSTLVLRVKPQP